MSDSDFTIPISQSEDSYNESSAEYGYQALNSGDILHQRYRIIRELGSGGFATTYLAVDHQSETQTKCAIKQLQPRFNSPSIWASAKERLATEAMVLQWLGNHQQIPELLAHFEDNKQFYLVLEFIEGEEFEQEVHRQVLNETQTIDFLFDVLEILEFVHQQGVIHRDIKPSNLIRRKQDGKMTLIDFGAVKEIGTLAFDTSKQKVQTQVIGTPGYMSPEQNNGKPVYSSDIYALGKTVIFGMTNKSPIEWEENESGEIIPWNEKLAVSEAFLAVINRMTALTTAERYTSATKVLNDLRPLQMIGKTIGENYQIIKYLGGERAIQSYIAKSLELGNHANYYLEILKPQQKEALSLSRTTEQIIAELAKLAAIENEDRVSRFAEYFIDEENLYLIQEYIEGDNLAQIIENQFVLSEVEVIDLIADTATALIPIHKQQIIHGNIKPSSLIKRSSDQKIALVDFGAISEAINLFPDSKTGYIPPEQIAGRLIFASDIYALGMTAIHVLTGISPQNLEKNPRTGEILWHRKARISPGFAKILDKMIRLDKRKRYKSMAQVVKDLKKIQHKSKLRAWYKYFIIAPILLGFVSIVLAQWAQRVAILEFYRADIKLEAKQYQEAIDYYDNGLKKIPKTRGQVRNFEQVWLKKGRALNELKRYDEALQTCSQALKYYQSYKLWNCQALALYSLKRYESAIAAYDQAISLDPQYLWAWNNRGEAYSQLGKTDLAIADFQKAIELDTARSFVAWNNLAKLHSEQKDYQRAIEAYNQALAVKKDYLPALIGLGNAQKNSARYSEAIDSYDRALRINPNYYEAWYGKGSVAEYLRDYQMAKESYQEAFDLKPDWEAVIKAIQRVDLKLGNY
jgi:eukaryotic-like serine/threonine-protein kinase